MLMSPKGRKQFLSYSLEGGKIYYHTACAFGILFSEMPDTDNVADSSVDKGGASATTMSAPQPFFKRRLVPVVIAIIVIVLAAAIGGGIYLWHKHQHKTPSIPPVTGQSAVNAAIAQANNGNTDSALSTLNTAIKNTTNKSQKSALYIQQGDIYSNDQNYSAALNSYQQAAQDDGLTYELAQSIAQTAQQAGNNQLAIEYYQKAIGLIPANDPTGGAEKNAFEKSISILESQ
jgi:tetratricopeptide (TPR) repeat protein